MSSVPQKQGLRILALPLTRPRTNGRPPLIFYHVQSPPEPPSKNPHMFRKAMDKAITTWTSFGKQEKSSWKFKLYAWGERAADRVEFEETSLKAVNTSFKPGAEKAEFDLGPVDQKAMFIHPSAFKDSLDAWREHVRVREPYHKRYFYLWALGLPITAPIGIAPIIPNIPFYFCAWRAWSHWKAWGSTTYLNQLFTLNYFEPKTDATLDKIYDSPVIPDGSTPATSKLSITDSPDTASIESDPAVEAQMLLRPDDVPIITSSFNLSPTVSAELLRALEQSRMRLKKEQKEQKEQKQG